MWFASSVASLAARLSEPEDGLHELSPFATGWRVRQELHDTLVKLVRKVAGKKLTPTAAIIDGAVHDNR